MIVGPRNSFRVIYDYTRLFCEKCVDISLFIPVHIPGKHKDCRINIISTFISQVQITGPNSSKRKHQYILANHNVAMLRIDLALRKIGAHLSNYVSLLENLNTTQHSVFCHYAGAAISCGSLHGGWSQVTTFVNRVSF